MRGEEWGGGGGGGVMVEVKILGRGVGFSCRWNCFLSTELEHIFEKMCGSFFSLLLFLINRRKSKQWQNSQNL